MVQQQKMMMYIMPVFMAFFCFIAPVGVLIYLLTTNFWTMGQQFYVLHNSPLPGSKAHEAHLKRQEEKAAKKAAKRGEPVDAVTSVVSSNGAKGKAGVGKAGATGTGATAGAVAGTGSPEDARSKPQRNQPVRTTRSGRKK
jgi:YidC/Oxa1 family membrane protein insertase